MPSDKIDTKQTGRRCSRTVYIGGVPIGSDHRVAVQSMTNTDTLDTAATVSQIGRVRDAGCRIVRVTTQGAREAANLQSIREQMDSAGYTDTALVADVHFSAPVALLAAAHADKVRINPGNYRDPDGGHFLELLEHCRKRGIPIRIGVNHGSLAERIVERWGDTPRGMVESAMEFLRACVRASFGDVVVSMKSSNVRVMVHAYRLLVDAMKRENMDFPLHLGVTEAGDGDYGRIKSAVGIGTLLADGIGDTIRVSLTEAPENEIPVANAIVDYCESVRRCVIDAGLPVGNLQCEYTRRDSSAVGKVGAGRIPVLYSELDAAALEGIEAEKIAVISCNDQGAALHFRESIIGMVSSGDKRPVILHKRYSEPSAETLQVKAAIDFGPALIDGLADGLWIENDPRLGITLQQLDDVALSIMQAARVRVSMTEFIACPGCGRTLFDLQSTLARVRESTAHLKGLKIGVMGCIVNGPGEMADADYGYVGAGPGNVTLYKGREAVVSSIPAEEAVDALIELIKSGGDWVDPACSRLNPNY